MGSETHPVARRVLNSTPPWILVRQCGVLRVENRRCQLGDSAVFAIRVSVNSLRCLNLYHEVFPIRMQPLPMLGMVSYLTLKHHCRHLLLVTHMIFLWIWSCQLQRRTSRWGTSWQPSH